MKNSYNDKSRKKASNNSSIKETTSNDSSLRNSSQDLRNVGSGRHEKNSSNDTVKDLVDKNNC